MIKQYARGPEVRAEKARLRAIVDKVIVEMGIDPKDIEAIHKARYTCPLCGAENLTRNSLHGHLKNVHGEKKLKCQHPGCKWSFTRIGNLKKHMLVHAEVKEVCTVCGAKSNNLKKHMTLHNRENFHQCPHCDKKFVDIRGLEYHIDNSHLGKIEKEMCPFCAVEVKHLKSHIQWEHEGKKNEKNFKCEHPECDRMFPTASLARGHYRGIHTYIREKCPICGGMYKNLQTHLTFIHRNKDKHKCQHCDKGFPKPYDLRLHMKRVHSVSQ